MRNIILVRREKVTGKAFQHARDVSQNTRENPLSLYRDVHYYIFRQSHSYKVFQEEDIQVLRIKYAYFSEQRIESRLAAVHKKSPQMGKA